MAPAPRFFWVCFLPCELLLTDPGGPTRGRSGRRRCEVPSGRGGAPRRLFWKLFSEPLEIESSRILMLEVEEVLFCFTVLFFHSSGQLVQAEDSRMRQRDLHLHRSGRGRAVPVQVWLLPVQQDGPLLPRYRQVWGSVAQGAGKVLFSARGTLSALGVTVLIWG